MTVPLTTSETLKHKINPSADMAEPQTVHVLLYTPGTAGLTTFHFHYFNHYCIPSPSVEPALPSRHNEKDSSAYFEWDVGNNGVGVETH